MSGASRTVAVVAGYAAAGALAVALWPGATAGAGPSEQPPPTPTETPMVTPPAPDPAWRPEHLLVGVGETCAVELTVEYPDRDVTMCWEPGCAVVVFDGAAPGVACGSVDVPLTSSQPDPLTLRYDSSATDCVEVTPRDRDARAPGPCPPPACPSGMYPFEYEPLRVARSKYACAIVTKNPYRPPIVTRPPAPPSTSPPAPAPTATTAAPGPRPASLTPAPTTAPASPVPPPTTAPASPVPAPVALPDRPAGRAGSTVPWLALPLLLAAGGGAVVWMRRARG